jgi:hypothetical protein
MAAREVRRRTNGKAQPITRASKIDGYGTIPPTHPPTKRVRR